MPVYEFEGKRPRIAASAFVYPEATIIGDVVIGEGCYIGPGARIRGDWGAIVIGANSNIQENCIIHSALMPLLCLPKGVMWAMVLFTQACSGGR